MRWRSEPRLLPRIVLSVAAFCALAGTVIAVYFVLQPTYVLERNGFIADFLALQWLYRPGDGYNLPCILGILALPCILLTMVRPTWG